MKEGQLAISQFLETNKTQFVSKQTSSSTVARLRDRFQKCEAKFQLQSSTNEQQFLREVLGRLELAAQQVAANVNYGATTELGRSLRVGQQNEIKNYRAKIRLAELKSQLAQSRLEVLKLQEEQGFSSELVLSPAKPANELIMTLSSLSLTNFLTVSNSTELFLESIVERKPIGSLPTLFRDFDINYDSIQLTNSTRYFSSSYRPSRYRSGSSFGNRSHVWTYQHGRGTRSRNKVSSFSLYGTSLYSGSRYSGTRNLGTRYTGTRFNANRFGPSFTAGYPFGVFDTRLRRLQTNGFPPPWLLPGTPSSYRW